MKIKKHVKLELKQRKTIITIKTRIWTEAIQNGSQGVNIADW